MEILVAILVIMAIAIFVAMGETSTPITGSTTETILANVNSTQTLSQTPTDLSAIRYNQTWLEFDGDNDVLTVNATNVESISFWYKNSTDGWQHIVNASGTMYVNGSLATPYLYPVYDDGSNINIGKSDDSTFHDVDIDDFRTYSVQIDSIQVQSIFNGGRE